MTDQHDKDQKSAINKQEDKSGSTDKDHAHHDKDHAHHGKQGFASMPSEQVKEIASKGGKASHKNQ